MRVYGINAVLEALRASRVTAIRVSAHADRAAAVVELAERQGVRVTRVTADELDRLAPRLGHRHQGIVAELRERAHVSVEDLVLRAAGAPLIVVLDSVEDPRNVGAIVRTVEAAGADGVVRQSRRAARLDGPAATRASAGAVAYVPVAEVVNIARAIETLKEVGVWSVGLAADARQRYDEIDLTLPTAFVVGAEATGLRRLVRDRCDHLVSIPMVGHVRSLNVAVATGIALFEAVRQRRQKSLQ